MELIQQGVVSDKEEPILTRMRDLHPHLFVAIPTYRNVLAQVYCQRFRVQGWGFRFQAHTRMCLHR